MEVLLINDFVNSTEIMVFMKNPLKMIYRFFYFLFFIFLLFFLIEAAPDELASSLQLFL